MGLATAAPASMMVPGTSKPHRIGWRGQRICKAEESLGLLFGLIDAVEGTSTVTLLVPKEELNLGETVVVFLAVVARTIFLRLYKGRQVVNPGRDGDIPGLLFWILLVNLVRYSRCIDAVTNSGE